MYPPPQVPASAGAILQDDKGRLLVLKPTYKSGWTIPGGMMEDNGESPWDACRREVREETHLRVTSGRLVVVDTRPAKTDRKLGLRFLFHCGVLTKKEVRSIRVQELEVKEFRFVEPRQAIEMLRSPISRRVAAGLAVPDGGCVYLENGYPVLDGRSGTSG